MSFARMGLLFLAKRRLRTALTVLAIILGVGIISAVNVTADSIDNAINAQIYDRLGTNDLVVRGNRSINGGWFNYQDAKNFLDDQIGVKHVVPRIIKSQPTYPFENSSTAWRVPIVGFDPSIPAEINFGKCNITNSLYPALENTTSIEALFNHYRNTQPTFLPVVLSKGYADAFGIKVGDPFYLWPENPNKVGAGFNSTNTSTWLKGTVIGIIIDTSKSVSDFMPPARIWEMQPSGRSVYLNIADAWQYIFNNHDGQVNMVFVNVDNPALIKTYNENIQKKAPEGLFPGGIFTEEVKALFTAGITQVNVLMRGIFSIFSAISLLVCAIIIKNLLEMAKEEQTLQIGIMRAIGVTKRKILTLYITQILAISVVGSLIGLGFGYYLSTFFVGSYVDTASAVGTDFSQFDLKPIMSPLTVLIGMGSGVLVSLIFGFIPARSAANIDPLKALRAESDRPKDSLFIRTLKGTGSLGIALAMTIGGIVIVGSAFGGLFILDIINPEIIVLLFIGVLLLIMGIVALGAFFFPVIVPILSKLFSPFLRQMHTITGRNLSRYSRQSKNTFAMLAIGLCMMITVGTIMNSAYAGAYPGGKTVTGGDLQIGDLARGQIPKDPHTLGLRNLPSVAQAVPIRFSIGFEGLTQIERLKTDTKFGGTSDSVFGPVRENFHLGIMDPLEYGQLHAKDSIVKLNNRQPLNDAMEKLETPYTIILQDRLARRMGGIEVNEIVRLRFEGFEADFKVVGIFEIMPGYYWSYYATESAFEKQFAGAISWNTYEKMVNDNIGKADLIARNKVIPPGEYADLLPDDRFWGYASVPVDYRTLEDIVYQTGLVLNSTRRITSPFFAVPQFQWQTNLTLIDPDQKLNWSEIDASKLNETAALQNVLWHKQGAITENWNGMFSRAVVLDPQTDHSFGSTRITSFLPQIPKNQSATLESIFTWASTNMAGQNVCIVNELYVNYNFTNGQIDYIKKFQPGETIRMNYNASIYSDFIVIATTNSHYPYAYVDNEDKHHGDTAVFNYEAMSFNTYTYNSTDWSYFFEVLDIEPNTVFLSPDAMKVPAQYVNSLIPDLTNQYLNQTNQTLPNSNQTSSINSPEYWWLNSTLQNIFSLNTTAFAGNLTTNQWVGNYSFNGTQFYFDGATVTIAGQTQNISISTSILNGTSILEQLANGSLLFQAENLTSVVMFDLDDSMTIEDINNLILTLEQICKLVPTLQNITFFSPKSFLVQKSGLFNAYFLVGAVSRDRINDALAEIEHYYIQNKLFWDSRWVSRSTEMEQQVGGILGLIVNMFFGVLSFALITSLLGLSISTLISVRKRYSEIGTLRTLGFSNGQILRMVIGEGVITAIVGIMVGLIAGLLIAGLIIFNLPFMIFLPIIFTPPYELIAAGLGLLIAASVGASFIPAVGAVKIDIADAIRTKGE
jgi:ABC-type antimicrobial peptide transport system permease subunit